jgi:hypothetical protein
MRCRECSCEGCIKYYEGPSGPTPGPWVLVGDEIKSKNTCDLLGYFYDDTAEGEANGRLAAEAPALLAALRDAHPPEGCGAKGYCPTCAVITRADPSVLNLLRTHSGR